VSRIYRWHRLGTYPDCRNPDPPTREMLAKRLGVPNVKTIGIWFQNRSDYEIPRSWGLSIDDPSRGLEKERPIYPDRSLWKGVDRLIG